VLLLQAEGMGEAAVAYALADLFGVRSGPDSKLAYDRAALVWQVKGKTQTRDALQRAAQTIQVIERRGRVLAVVSLFGHEFVVTSGTQARNAAQPVWLNREQIEQHFRESRPFEELWGEDDA
jgi:hypothetical protein